LRGDGGEGLPPVGGGGLPPTGGEGLPPIVGGAGLFPFGDEGPFPTLGGGLPMPPPDGRPPARGGTGPFGLLVGAPPPIGIGMPPPWCPPPLLPFSAERMGALRSFVWAFFSFLPFSMLFRRAPRSLVLGGGAETAGGGGAPGGGGGGPMPNILVGSLTEEREWILSR